MNIDDMERRKFEKALKEQQCYDEKEKLTKEISKVGGLISTVRRLQEICCKEKQKDLKTILQKQILYVLYQ